MDLCAAGLLTGPYFFCIWLLITKIMGNTNKKPGKDSAILGEILVR
jgi:hypothetical protein